MSYILSYIVIFCHIHPLIVMSSKRPRPEYTPRHGFLGHARRPNLMNSLVSLRWKFSKFTTKCRWLVYKCLQVGGNWKWCNDSNLSTVLLLGSQKETWCSRKVSSGRGIPKVSGVCSSCKDLSICKMTSWNFIKFANLKKCKFNTCPRLFFILLVWFFVTLLMM